MATSPMTEPQAGSLLRARTPRVAVRLPLLWLGIAALMALSLLQVRTIDRHFNAGLHHNDLIGRWYGTRAALHGEDPYSPALTRQIQAIADHDKSTAFDYPAQFAVLMVPLALLSWKTASVLYLVFVIPGLVLAIGLCLRLVNRRLSLHAMALITFAALGSWPVVWGLRLWQPGLLVAICAFAGCYWISRGRGAAAGILFGLAAIKPQLVLPIILALVLWTGLRRQWSFLLSLTVTSVVLLALAEWMMPGWIPHWLASLHGYQSYCNKLPLETLIGSGLSRGIAGLLVLGTAWRLWTLRGCRAPSAAFGYGVALLLALPVAINTTTPLMIYNDLLLLPGCVLLYATRSSGAALPLLARRFAQLWLVWALLCVPVAALADAISGASLIGAKLVFMNPFFASAVTLFLLLNPPVLEREAPAMDAATQTA
ncbi:MAG TPA: glycosyltransferase family 87 protein [Acidobacteriaceae bacterium]|nr:glycosyltransferase family 87 protein [Acidobacteriaceae bacterium]